MRWALAASLALVTAGACKREPPAASPVATSVSEDPRTRTEVTVTRDKNSPANPLCMDFCDRLARCWLAVADADVMLSENDVRAKCRTENDDCRTSSTQAMCCTTITDCHDFAACYTKSTDAPSVCGP